VERRSASTSFAFERSAAAVAFDIHPENGGMVDDAIGDGHGLVPKDLAHFPMRTLGFGLVLGNLRRGCRESAG
jgi:hypothetical protein